MSGSIRTDTSLKNIKPPLFTRKAEVSLEVEIKQNNMERQVEDLDRLCPLHNKPHPLIMGSAARL